jgi:hypothetical protein
MRMLELQQYRCALTGQPLTPETAVLDHIVPLSRGGEHTAQNIWVLHRDVNQAKGKLLLSELYSLCELLVGHRTGAERIQQLAAGGWREHQLRQISLSDLEAK